MLPGVPVPHLLVPKLTIPTKNQGVVLSVRLTNGPPESPLQLSLPKEIKDLSHFFLETCHCKHIYVCAYHLVLLHIIESFLNHNF